MSSSSARFLCPRRADPLFPTELVFGPLGLTITAGSGDDDIIGGLGSDFINPGTGNDFVDGNGPNVGNFNCFQDDILGEYGLSPFFTGDIIDLSGITTDVTVVINEDGSITITGSYGRCDRDRGHHHRIRQRHADRELGE